MVDMRSLVDKLKSAKISMNEKKKNIIENKEQNKEYTSLISSISALLEDARQRVYTQVNQILVKTYWQIGRRIVEFEQEGEKRAEYGSRLLDNLSCDLTGKYGRGFSRDNLEKMRKLYLLFSKSETLSRKLSWSHYCLIMRLNNAP